MASRFPSVATILRDLADCKEDAVRIRKIFETDLHPLRKLERINTIVGAHGVEYIADVRDDDINYHGIEYINMGDSYIPTVCWDRDTDRIFISSWGDIVERNPRRFGHE